MEAIARGGPADSAGLQLFDVIVTLDGKPLPFRDDAGALAFFETLKPGQRLTLRVIRAQRARDVIVLAVEMPAQFRARWNLNRELIKQYSTRE